jgi:hypothetical protein
VKAGEPAARRWAVLVGPLLALVAIALAWLTAPLVASSMGFEAEALRPVLVAASLATPLSYTATAWLPLAIGLDLAAARRACLGALVLMAPVGWLAARWGAVGGVLTLAVGQALFCALVAPLVLRRRSALSPPGEAGRGYSRANDA